MPIYRFTCPNRGCTAFNRVIRRLIDRAEGARNPGATGQLLVGKCKTCGGDLRRAPALTGTSVVERLDNGAMARAVERPVDIHEMVQEHKRKV